MVTPGPSSSVPTLPAGSVELKNRSFQNPYSQSHCCFSFFKRRKLGEQTAPLRVLEGRPREEHVHATSAEVLSSGPSTHIQAAHSRLELQRWDLTFSSSLHGHLRTRAQRHQYTRLNIVSKVLSSQSPFLWAADAAVVGLPVLCWAECLWRWDAGRKDWRNPCAKWLYTLRQLLPAEWPEGSGLQCHAAFRVPVQKPGAHSPS